MLCGCNGSLMTLRDFLGLPLGVQLLQAGQHTPGNVLGHAHHPPRRLVVHAGAGAVPGGEAACQKPLYGALW